jgi:hypothetical protein
MLSRKLGIGIILVVALLLSACATGGRIVILEEPHGKGFAMDFTNFNANNKCTLALADGDVVQVEIVRDSGRIDLSVSGLKGSEPYRGNDLKTNTFTVRVSETDDYVFRITGNKANGKITVKNLGSEVEER